MTRNLSDYRIVNPKTRNFSAAEARASWTTFRFNNLSAAELGYPDFVRLLISEDGNTLAVQSCPQDDPCAVPFMLDRTADDLNGQRRWISIQNRMLLQIIREKQHWDSTKVQRRFYGVPWAEERAILFDLTRIAPRKSRIPALTPDEMIRTYAHAANSTFLPVVLGGPAYPGYRPVPSGRQYGPNAVDADYTVM